MKSHALARVVQEIKTGDFLDRARVRRIAVIYLVVTVASLAVLLATSDGLKDALGRPLGSDFVAFHVAGAIALEDGGAAAYNPEKQYAEHRELLGEEAPRFWPFLYPPAFIFIAMGLASLPYLAGWLAWMAGTLGLYAGAMQKLAPGKFAGLLALAFPPVYTNFLHGQNGFLIAALFAIGLHLLSARRAILAGLALGLIAIKPQYGLLIPVALAAAGEWRAFAAAAASAASLAALPTLAFGPDAWTGFFATMQAARIEVVEAGAIGFEKIESVFAQARFLGAPVALAYAAQGAMIVALIAFVFLLWRSKARDEAKGGGLIVASILATPYAVDYDLVILAPAMALLIRDGLARGFAPYEKTIYLFAAFAPVIARPIGAATHLSMGLAGMLFLLAVALRRTR
ncbi:MAG: glycosyltransferase family 87 protein [Pseudomonadota bacterium]